MYNISWLVPHSVLLIHAEGEVTSNEIRSSLSMMHVMLDGIEEPVHCVVDNRKVEKSPLNLSLIPRNPEYTGITVQVDHPDKSQLFTKMMTRFISKQAVKTVPSLDDARHYLETVEAKAVQSQSVEV